VRSGRVFLPNQNRSIHTTIRTGYGPAITLLKPNHLSHYPFLIIIWFLRKTFCFPRSFHTHSSLPSKIKSTFPYLNVHFFFFSTTPRGDASIIRSPFLSHGKWSHTNHVLFFFIPIKVIFFLSLGKRKNNNQFLCSA
jgi:hypothetical protein